MHIAIGQTGGFVELPVANEGPGIGVDDRERVFERFWRADPGRARSRGGTGVGLAIVASLVEAHGGSVVAASETGHGIGFVVRLPTVPAMICTNHTE